MTLTLTVAWALFALAPGLAAFAGLFLGRGKDIVHPAGPAPASLLSLGLVVFGALVLHAFAASVLAVNDLMALSLDRPAKVPFDPNVYRYFLGDRQGDAGLETALLFALLLVLSGIGFWATSQVRRCTRAGSTLHSLLYGWLSPVLSQLRPAPGVSKHMIAWVLTDLTIGDLAVGYEAQVETLSLDSERRIAWLTLRDCETFVVGAGDAAAPRRRPVLRDTPIPHMQVEGAHIVNFAYAVVVVPDAIVPAPKSVENPNG